MGNLLDKVHQEREKESLKYEKMMTQRTMGQRLPPPPPPPASQQPQGEAKEVSDSYTPDIKSW